MLEIAENPITIAAVFYAVVELTKYVKNRKNFGLSEEEKIDLKYVRIVSEKFNDHYMKSHALSEDRQERMLTCLDDISKNCLAMSSVLDRILDKLDRK